MESKTNKAGSVLDKILDENDLDTEQPESNEGQQEIAEAVKVQFKKVSHKIPSPLQLHTKFLIGNQLFQVYDVKNKQRYYIRRLGIVEED